MNTNKNCFGKRRLLERQQCEALRSNNSKRRSFRMLSFSWQEEKQKGSFWLCLLKGEKECCSLPRTTITQLGTNRCIYWESGINRFFNKTYTLRPYPGFEINTDLLPGKWAGALRKGPWWRTEGRDAVSPLSLPLRWFALVEGYLSCFVILSLWIVFGHWSDHK